MWGKPKIGLDVDVVVDVDVGVGVVVPVLKLLWSWKCASTSWLMSSNAVSTSFANKLTVSLKMPARNKGSDFFVGRYPAMGVRLCNGRVDATHSDGELAVFAAFGCATHGGEHS